VLLSDDGQVFRLDVDYVVGREPTELPANARALALRGNASGVSRHHALITVVGGGVRVTDLGSTNGTYLLMPDRSEPVLLGAGESADIPSGTQIMLAKRSFFYESMGDFGKRA
jgi:pSer/pThr/pTyr-binding forkhead associated (FHA) protein